MKSAFHILPQFLLFRCLLIVLSQDPTIACYKLSKLHGVASRKIFSLRHARSLQTNIPKFNLKFRYLVSVRRPCILRSVSVRLCTPECSRSQRFEPRTAPVGSVLDEVALRQVLPDYRFSLLSTIHLSVTDIRPT